VGGSVGVWMTVSVRVGACVFIPPPIQSPNLTVPNPKSPLCTRNPRTAKHLNNFAGTVDADSGVFFK